MSSFRGSLQVDLTYLFLWCQTPFICIGKIRTRIVEYWNDGLRRRKKHEGFASPHYSSIPILQKIALRDNGVLRNSGMSTKDNENAEEAHYAELAWILSEGKTIKNERSDK